MRIAFITAGAAGMYCGSCMRDNTLASALIALGHEATLVPTFTPITTDEKDVSTGQVFLGGVNVFLQEKSSLFRHTPRFLDRLFNTRWLFKLIARFSSNTDYSTLGGLTISMLQGTHGHQRKEMFKLVDYLKNELKPEVVLLTNALLSGVIPEIRQQLGVPVFTTLQGDDIFLDALHESDRQRCIALIREHDAHTAGYISTCRDYADYMSDYLNLPRHKFEVIYPGINPAGHGPLTERPKRPPTIGYFARIAPEKGFANLVEAFIQLKRQPNTEEVRLRYSGWLGKKSIPYHDALVKKLADNGLSGSVEFVSCATHAEKVKFFQSVDVLSVPTVFREPKGLYILEAWANGVPLVQPSHGSFTELLQHGGGVLVPPRDNAALAKELLALLNDHARRRELGEQGRARFLEQFTAAHMAKATLRMLEERTARPSLARSASAG